MKIVIALGAIAMILAVVIAAYRRSMRDPAYSRRFASSPGAETSGWLYTPPASYGGDSSGAHHGGHAGSHCDAGGASHGGFSGGDCGGGGHGGHGGH